ERVPKSIPRAYRGIAHLVRIRKCGRIAPAVDYAPKSMESCPAAVLTDAMPKSIIQIGLVRNKPRPGRVSFVKSGLEGVKQGCLIPLKI
ncbi:MAG: hypothetical protein WHZ52_01145, partial [Armatimonadota bacterium]